MTKRPGVVPNEVTPLRPKAFDVHNAWLRGEEQPDMRELQASFSTALGRDVSYGGLPWSQLANGPVLGAVGPIATGGAGARQNTDPPHLDVYMGQYAPICHEASRSEGSGRSIVLWTTVVVAIIVAAAAIPLIVLPGHRAIPLRGLPTNPAPSNSSAQARVPIPESLNPGSQSAPAPAPSPPPAPSPAAQLPPLELPDIPPLKGVDAIPAMLTWMGRRSVADVLGASISELAPFLPSKLDKSDTQPYVPSYVLKIPDSDRKLSLMVGFVDDKVLRIGTWTLMKARDVSKLLRSYRRPDRTEDDTGTRTMTWNMGLMLLEVSVPPGDKPIVQWWLYDSSRYDAFVELDRVTRAAFAQSDKAATLVQAGDPESLSQAATHYEKAVDLVPAYSITWLRLCRLYYKLDQLDSARLACSRARDQSAHDDVISAATKLLEKL